MSDLSVRQVFKKRFQYFKSARTNFPLSTQVLLVYALTAVRNFLNMHHPDDLDDYNKVEDETIDEEDARIAEVESNKGINQRRDEIAELMWISYYRVIGRPL